MNAGNSGPETIQDPQLEIQKLEAEHDRLTEERNQCNLLARKLMEKEARGEGPFAKEIYGHKQNSFVLATRMQHIRAKINRIKLGLEVL